MKVWKKLSAVAFVFVMALTLCVMASAAANEQLTNGVAKDGTEPYGYDAIRNTLQIPKSITVTGTDLSAVYGPDVTYKYTITPAVVTGITVSDGITTARPVKAGIPEGVTLSDVVFTSSAVSLASGSGSVTGNLVATVDLSKFTAPGIYRYAITEHTDNTAALYAAGVTRPAVDSFFLDVYIRNDTETVGGTPTEVRKVYGFVLLNANDSITTGNASEKKVSQLTTDTYATMNITVTKSVTGNMGDKTHEFPFAITVSNSGMYFYSGKTTASETAATTTSLSPTLKDGETFVIKGLNPKATVSFTETNNTPDEYTVSVQDNASTVFVAAATVAANGTKATEALAVSNYNTENSATNVTVAPTPSVYSAITFINNLDAISPTGVALRYAPYLAMLGAGVVALPMSLRKKEEEF